jgi:hypothetical protein
MSTTTQPRQRQSPSLQEPARRIWRAPAARTRWFWIPFAFVISAAIFIWYRIAVAANPYASAFVDPLRLFGIVAFALVVLSAAYTLRRRYVRGLPGMAREWLQMHIWLGLASIFIALMHENFVLFSDCVNVSCVTQYTAGTSAFIALVVLVATGILGRLLDIWQARVISHEASTNGVGIVQSIEEQLPKRRAQIDRLQAGQSDTLNHYCQDVLDRGRIPAHPPEMTSREMHDFHQINAALIEYTELERSLKRQRRAKFVMRGWRYVHITVATGALLVIGLHSGIELLKLALELLKVHVR